MRIISKIFLAVLLFMTHIAAGPRIFTYRIPPGWKFRDALISKSGMKALVIWQDVDNFIALQGRFSSRLVVYDKDDNPINDIVFDKPEFLHFMRDDKILLSESKNEKVEKAMVFDSRGEKIVEFATQSRWLYPALFGGEIGLAHEDIGGPHIIWGPISIIDGETGTEKMSFTLPPGRTLRAFCPIGIGGNYIYAMGSTVIMKSYLHPEAEIWRIENIGGHVRGIYLLDDRSVSILYAGEEGKKWKPLSGLAVVEWETGRIVLNRFSEDRRSELLQILSHTVEKDGGTGDLLFYDFGKKTVSRILKGNLDLDPWDETLFKKHRIENWPEKTFLIFASRHLYRVENGILSIEKMRLKETEESR